MGLKEKETIDGLDELEGSEYIELINVAYSVLKQYYPDTRPSDFLLSVLDFLCTYEARLDGVSDENLDEESMKKINELDDENVIENISEYLEKISSENVKYSILYAFLSIVRNKEVYEEEPERMFG